MLSEKPLFVAFVIATIRSSSKHFLCFRVCTGLWDKGLAETWPDNRRMIPGERKWAVAVQPGDCPSPEFLRTQCCDRLSTWSGRDGIENP